MSSTHKQVSLMLTEDQKRALDLAAVLSGTARKNWVNEALKQAAERLCGDAKLEPFRDQVASVWS